MRFAPGVEGGIGSAVSLRDFLRGASGEKDRGRLAPPVGEIISEEDRWEGVRRDWARTAGGGSLEEDEAGRARGVDLGFGFGLGGRGTGVGLDSV